MVPVHQDDHFTSFKTWIDSPLRIKIPFSTLNPANHQSGRVPKPKAQGQAIKTAIVAYKANVKGLKFKFTRAPLLQSEN